MRTTTLRRTAACAACVLSLLLAAAPAAAAGAAGLVGTWVGETLDGAPVELKFDANGQFVVNGRRGTYSFTGATLILKLDGRMESYSHRLSGSRLELSGSLFPFGVELFEVVAGRPPPRPTPRPDAVIHAPDRPRAFSPDGRASFIVPDGLSGEWFDRPGFGELLLRSATEPELRLLLRVGRLDEPDRRLEPKKLLERLAGALGPDLPPIRPAAAPQQGTLWRWPARSVEIEARDPDGAALRGWTALCLARPWYALVVAVGPAAKRAQTLALGRRFFHDLRLRPAELHRERELQLAGTWVPVGADGGEARLWFGRSGNFHWTRREGEHEGRFQVRGDVLLLRWGDAEKELQLRFLPEEAGQRQIELAGRPWRRTSAERQD